MERLRGSIQYYGAAILGGAVAVFVGVEGWRSLIWFSSFPSSETPNSIAHPGDWLAFLIYALSAVIFVRMYVRVEGRHHLILGLSYLLFATGSVYGSLDVLYSWVASIPGWADSLQTERSFLGLLNQSALTITCLVMSVLLTTYLILHRHRQN